MVHILQENPDMAQRELAERLAISGGGLNYRIKAMMEKDLVKMKNFACSRGKFDYVYVLTSGGIVEKAVTGGRFLQRKIGEFEALRAEVEALTSAMTTPARKEFKQYD